MPLKASDVFKVLETDFSFGNDNTSNSNSSIDNNDSTLENPYDPGDMFPSEDYTDDLLKQCDKILTEYPALDIIDFAKSNYITEEFIDQLSPDEEANIHQTSSSPKPPLPPSAPPPPPPPSSPKPPPPPSVSPPPPPTQNVIPQSMAKKRKRPRSKKDCIEVQKSKHPLLSAACTPKCSLTCTNRIDEEKRIQLHEGFWCLEYNLRKMWIAKHVDQYPVKRRRKSDSIHIRSNSRTYKFLSDDNTAVQVCKSFFLSTLGFTSDQVITTSLKSPTFTEDKRRKHAPSNKFTDAVVETIKNHIFSYHPSVSHYRRAHAPLRLYLPPELSIKEMHDDYKSKYLESPVHYNVYREYIKKYNIGFTKLGEEECESCIEHDLHLKDVNNHDGAVTVNDNESCEACLYHEQHLQLARLGRRQYKKDRYSPEEGMCYISADMQKVIMIPRIPGCKTVIFQRRLTVYHQTFSPRGKANESLGIVWHSGLMGRNDEDVASAYVAALRSIQFRDIQFLTIWVDNCSAQNKSWTLFTALCLEVNSCMSITEVTLKYFEKGHTFMSCDSFHHSVEQGMRDAKNIYDFNDFKEVVASKGNCEALEQFTDFPNGSNQSKAKPKLQKVKIIQFRRGKTDIFWKEKYDQTDFSSTPFLKKKIMKIIKDKKGSILNPLKVYLRIERV